MQRRRVHGGDERRSLKWRCTNDRRGHQFAALDEWKGSQSSGQEADVDEEIDYGPECGGSA
ncbi:hypothetical protein CBS101457_000135 [Exobasidium rhododendri]|nr:hypothetical protein CBS101457_000135 [Exobasidium rhododendri]